MVSSTRRVAVHALRVGLLAAIIVLIHLRHARSVFERRRDLLDEPGLARLRRFYPEAASLAPAAGAQGEFDILDGSGRPLGRVVRTSPECDSIIGFSGPTNVLLAFGKDERIVGVEILSSGDTRDHVRAVRDDPVFLPSFVGLSRSRAAAETEVDAVSGATLTSLAIRESIVHRLGGRRSSLHFAAPLAVSEISGLFPAAATVVAREGGGSLWVVRDGDGEELGTVLRTSPAADHVVGYQGPSESLIALDRGGRVVRISLRKSYDNEPYVRYVREDDVFPRLFEGLSLEELAALDPEAAGIEGVSGATMTSMAIAEGLRRAAREHREVAAGTGAAVPVKLHDLGTALTVAIALVVGLTRLRSSRAARVALRLVLVAYLGLTAGSMLSQAMLVGWAQNGVPWRSAPGLVLLTAAAFLLPITTRRNLYCSHLCPHGAAQQLLKRRLPWRMRLPRSVSRTLALAPALLLVWCVVVPVLSLGFSLIDIEPFDAWLLGVAGWATGLVAGVGLFASLFVPMAYCRYGCPTGALLGFLRFHSRSERWTRRDSLAVILAGLALGSWLW